METITLTGKNLMTGSEVAYNLTQLTENKKLYRDQYGDLWTCAMAGWTIVNKYYPELV